MIICSYFISDFYKNMLIIFSTAFQSPYGLILFSNLYLLSFNIRLLRAKFVRNSTVSIHSVFFLMVRQEVTSARYDFNIHPSILVFHSVKNFSNPYLFFRI